MPTVPRRPLASTVAAAGLLFVAPLRAGDVAFGPALVVDGFAAGASSLAAVDVDGDGDLDLVVGRTTAVVASPSQSDSITWFEHAGPDWTPHVVSAEQEGGQLVAARDLDGDGDADVLSASALGANVSWHENLDGRGRSWTRHALVEGVAAPVAVSAHDLDGDGDLDVLSMSAANSASDPVGLCIWQANTDGLGHFGAPQTILAAGAVRAEPADLDGDGDLDLAAGRADHLAWYVNVDGLGHFVLAQAFDEYFGVQAVRTGDLDGDGDVDLALAAASSTYALAWHANLDGQGTFGAAQVVTPFESVLTDIALVDLDGDADLDLAAAGRATGRNVGWHENLDALGTFGAAQTVAPAVGSLDALASADLDGDGDADLLVGQAQAGALEPADLRWYENLDGAGSFGAARPIEAVGKHALVVLAVDVDGDGDLDALSATNATASLAVLGWNENLDGLGHFAPRVVFSSGVLHLPVDALALDVDDDGDLDVLVADGQGTLGAFENLDGRGTFGPLVPVEAVALSVAAVALDAGDVDRDGEPDLIAARSTPFVDDRVAWFAGDGAGTFAAPSVVLASSDANPTDVAGADLDLDGDLDLVLGRDHAVPASWSRNLDGAGGAWATSDVWTSPSGAPDADTRVALDDLDGDGDPDLLVRAVVSPTAPSWWELRRFENVGGPALFDAGTLVTSQMVQGAFAPADLDGDGDPDLASGGAGQLGWIENLGPWTDEGHALVGAWGQPHLWGDGSLAGGSEQALHLSHAAPDAPVFVVLGNAALLAPFKGGTLVPTPLVVLGPVPATHAGTLDVAFLAPLGLPSGAQVHSQWWVVDPIGPVGFSASNGVLGVVP
ncbi:MAG: VCBS repeat-containing protein [Planctomycetes bacterium]|nr:VCBS repeat-containing protein [Planctomycetota bacterium]